MTPSLSRRRAFFTAAAALSCPLCVARAADPARGPEESAHGPHWGYSGEAGPEKWGQLQPDFRVCDLGMEQTPIDLTGGVKADPGPVRPVFQPMKAAVLNNGHTIQVNCPSGSFTEIAGTRYDLAQFHFHHPSEHLLSGKHFDLELHFVHRSAAGALAVLGVFIEPGAVNAVLEPVWSAMPDTEAPPREIGATIGPAGLLPAETGFFRYAGSLTTPPCSEGVLWTVYREPIEASPEQIRRFAALFPVNARPLRPVNRRFLLESL